MPLPLSGLLVRGVGLGAVEEYLKKKRGQRSGHPHSRGHRGSRGQFRTPGYDILECERGPPGPFRPDNEWPGGRPNGHPETCSMGNPWMHHLEQMAPPRRRRSSRMPPRTPFSSPIPYRGQSFAPPRGGRNHLYHDPRFHFSSRPRYEDEEEDDEDDEEDDEDWPEDGGYSSDGFDDGEGFSLGGRSYERRRPHFDDHRGHSRMHQGHHHGREPYGRYGDSRHPPRDQYSTQPAGYYNTRVPGRYPSDDYRPGMHHDELRSRASSEDSW